MILGRGSHRVHTVHSRQASKFALYRTQRVNRGKYRGKGLAFVTGEIWGSQGYILFIRRYCTGYVVFDTLYLTPYRSTVLHTLPCIGLQYPIPCILYPMPDATYTRKKPDTSDDVSGVGYRTKKSPAGVESCRACNERRVVTYSTAGLEVSAPSMPAIVIVTSPMNIEPND